MTRHARTARSTRPRVVTVAAIALAAAAAAVRPAPAAAQSHDAETVRQTYTFLADRLTVRVDAGVPGTLRLIRGQPGRLEVTARVLRGLPGFGLSDQGGHVLQVTTVGGEHADYILVVPEAVRVLVRLPDRPVAEVVGARQDAATFRWHTPGG